MTNELSLPPADVWRMAEAVSKSGMYGMKTADQAFALMMLCQAEGMPGIKAVTRYHIIQGRPTMRSDAMLAEFQRRGGTIRYLEHNQQAVEIEFSHPSGGTLPVRWTVDDAKRANLIGKDVWRQYPRAMLSARCVSEGVRAVLPDCIVGIYTPEEAESLPPTDAGIAELEERREAHSRANEGRVELTDTAEPARAGLLTNSPGVDRFDGHVLNVDERAVVERNKTRTVYDITLAREDKSTLLVGTRKLDIAEAARSLREDEFPVIASIKPQAKGGWQLLSIERAEEIKAAA